jgi:hypothetical protein
LSGQHAATHDEKQSMNSLGSMGFMMQRSQSAQGMPKWNSAKPRRKARCALPQSVIVAARDRAAHHQEQYLAQRIHDLPALPRIRNLGEVIKQGGKARPR